jgi:hypothetical protein
MAGKGREVGVWIAGVGAGILFFGSVWSGAALADDPIPTVPIDPPPVTMVTPNDPIPTVPIDPPPVSTVTPAPGGTGSVTTGASPGAAAPAGSAMTDNYCRYFPSQAAAQVYFTSAGGSATNNARYLDANHNGIACELYEYGTAATPAADTAGALGSTTGPPQVSVVPRGGVNTGDGSFTP